MAAFIPPLTKPTHTFFLTIKKPPFFNLLVWLARTSHQPGIADDDRKDARRPPCTTTHWPHFRVLEVPCLVFIDAGSKMSPPFFLILLTENT